jgi:Holliday junction DNA helicase RuvA
VIGSLRGQVLERSTDTEVLVEVQGVGYRVTVAPRTLAELEPGAKVFLHVHHHIREDAQQLYGFLTRDERVCFEALLGAHGVGPALAMAILSVHSPGALREVVAAADLRSLCLVPGVGKKTAERLLVELRGRLDVPDVDVLAAVRGAAPGAGGAPSVLADVREALAGLGYGPDEVRDALRDLSVDGRDAPGLLRDALKALGVRRA